MIRKIIKRNKKGSYPSPITDFLAMTTFILVSFLFFVILKGAKEGAANTIQSQNAVTQAELNLMSYLRTPIGYERQVGSGEETISIAELIMISVKKRNYDVLKDKSQEIFKDSGLFWDAEISILVDDYWIKTTSFGSDDLAPDKKAVPARARTELPLIPESGNIDKIAIDLTINKGEK